MRKVVAVEWMSLDGVVQSTGAILAAYAVER